MTRSRGTRGSNTGVDEEQLELPVVHIRPKRRTNGYDSHCKINKSFTSMDAKCHLFRDTFNQQQKRATSPAKPSRWNPAEKYPVNAVETSIPRLVKCSCVACCVVLQSIDTFKDPESTYLETYPLLIISSSEHIFRVWFNQRDGLCEMSIEDMKVEIFVKESQFEIGGRYFLFVPSPTKGQISQRLPFLGIGWGRIVSQNPASERVVSLIQSWLSECFEHHRRCNWNPDRWPSRLIDVGKNDKCIRLHETKNNPTHSKEEIRYVALSYCWGSSGPWATTTTATLQDNMNGIASESIPKTVKDAITITRMLGIRYLWVDALCIIQDSQADWAKECVQMCTVYENALLVLRAEVAPNSDYGLFTRSSRRYCIALEINAPKSQKLKKRKHRKPRNKGKGHTIFVRESSCINDQGIPNVTHGLFCPKPIYTRGWVFQERYFSVRTVVFGAEEIGWECRSCQACECRLSSRIQSIEKVSPVELVKGIYGQLIPGYFSWFENWLTCIEEYSRLALTQSSDRLAAISGVASYFLRVRDMSMDNLISEQLISGMWKSNLWKELLWYTGWTSNSLGRPNFGIPSWSWSSITSEINFAAPYTKFDSRINVEDIHWALQNPENPFGNVKYAKVSISAPLFRVFLDTSTEIRPGCSVEVTISSNLDPEIDLEPIVSRDLTHLLQRATINILTTMWRPGPTYLTLHIDFRRDYHDSNSLKELEGLKLYLLLGFYSLTSGTVSCCGLILHRCLDATTQDVYRRVGFWEASRIEGLSYFNKTRRFSNPEGTFLENQRRSLFHII